MSAALQLDDIVRRFPGPQRGLFVHALNGVSLTVNAGETVALVGESGSGKSTLGRIAVRLDRPDEGTVTIAGRDTTRLSLASLRPLRAMMQMVFQDPWGTLNPRRSIGAAIEEPLVLHGKLDATARRATVLRMLERVRLQPELLTRYPAQLSGGQLQRVAIARALVTNPKLVVLDEPTSSLDLSVRADILQLLRQLQEEFGTAFLFITHDIGTVRLIADRIIVLYLGSIMEEGPATSVLASPRHPYTRALLSAEPGTFPGQHRQRIMLDGEIPSPLNLPPGCPFATRCQYAIPACANAKPQLVQGVACIRSREIGEQPAMRE